MAQEKIAQYYLLCGVIEPKNHMIEVLNEAEKKLLFSSAELSEYFKSIAGRVLINETIVGGGQQVHEEASVQIFEW